MKHCLFCVGALTVGGLMLNAGLAQAESAQFYNLEGFGSWLDGNPETTTVTEDGTVALGPGVRERYEDAAASFSAAAPLGDEVVVARVDDAAVIAIDRAGKTREIFTPDETLVTSILTVGSDIYVAAGPPAKLYKVDSRGKSKVMFTPDADYIWDMTSDGKGNLYLATGAPGEVIRVSSRGKGETIFAPEQLHLRSITHDSYLGLFVGGGEKGIVYRAKKPQDVKALPKDPEARKKRQKEGKAFRALYDSGHPEITAIVLQDNLAFAAAVTGAQALASAQGNEQQGGKRGKGPEVRSQLIRIGMDGTSEVLAGSNDEAIFDLIVDDKKQVLVATGATGRDDPRGRLYSIHPTKRKIGMIYQSPSRRITHLVQLPRDALAAVAAAGGRITHVTGGYSFKGEFFTVPFDANINAAWGMVEVFGVWEKGTKVKASVRTGQTKIPDGSWTDWSREVEAPGRVSPHNERGRYMQLRLRLEGDGKQTPEVHRVRVAYLRQNLPPFVREVVTLRKGLALLPIFQEQNKSKTVSLKDKANPDTRRSGAGEKKPPSSGVRARQVEKDGAMTVKWVAEDPNGDRLRYNLQVRGQGERTWRTVEDELDQPFYTFHSSQFPDGHYQFRVEATDSPSNPDGTELTDSRDSRAVLVDNTPPKVEEPDIQLNGRRGTARVSVADQVGPLTEAQFSLDGAPFRPLLPDDGVLDGPGEVFTIRFGDLGPGTHTLTIRVTDEADNVGSGQTRFTVR